MVRWRRMRQSGNVSDRRGMGKGLLGGGIVTIVAVIAALLFGVDPSAVLQVGEAVQQNTQPRGGAPPESDEQAQMVEAFLGSTEDVWGDVFRASGAGAYREPTLVLFSGSTRSGCGHASSAVGPFYCPLDGTVYLDMSFFDELGRRFGAPGDFGQAYVIAHEVGHHVQNLTGVADQVRSAQQSAASRAQANELQVRMELQADCYAGVWAARADRVDAVLEPGDSEEGMRAAAASGDDRLQRQTQGQVMPETFTHGTSEQRQRWLRRGLETGDPSACDAFGQPHL